MQKETKLDIHSKSFHHTEDEAAKMTRTKSIGLRREQQISSIT